MATYINNNVKFHAFSKSPVSPDTTLGGAVNPSGHTITTSQVRSQDIPAFLNTFQGTKDTAITWLGTNYATPANNDIAYYGGEFKAGFSTPKCLKYNGETSTWEDFDITAAATLKNADGKDVIAVHQNCTTVFVDGGNNAATNSNRWSLFVKKSDGSILDHFVASTDKIVAGMPSLGYNALVLWNGAAIDEGELDANYVGNTFAGIIHLNKQYSTGDDAKFKVTCFEYIGEKLDESITSISDSVKDIVNTTMQGVVASVGTTTEATAAGISVDSSVTTSPKIDITTGSVTSGETKLVTGGAVKTYVDTTALAEGGSIAQKIAEAKQAAIDSAKVTLTAGTGITIPNSGTAQTAFTVSVDTDVIATKQSVDDLSGLVTALSETVGSNKTELEGKITAAETAASTALETAKTEIKGTTDALDSRLTDAESGIEALTTGDNSVAKQIETAANAIKAQSLAQTGTLTGMFSVATTGTVGTGITGITITDAGLADAITKAKTDAETTAATNLATARGEITTEISDAVSGLETKLTTGEGSLGAKVAALETATGTTLPAAIEQALTDAKAYSDSLHTTSLDYVVLGDSESLPTASADTLGKIYLVASQNAPAADGSAISGSYVEYMTRKVGEGDTATYTWEKIGTTAADLNSYAKGIKYGMGGTYSVDSDGYINIGTIIKGASIVDRNDPMNQGTNINILQGNTFGTSKDGTRLLVSSATENIFGLVKITDTIDTSDEAADKATTSTAVKSYADTKVGDVDYFGENDLLSTKAEIVDGKLVVTEQEIINPNGSNPWNANVTKVVNNEAFIGDTKYATIETNKIKDGSEMFYHTSLSEFDSDLDSLTAGDWMFADSDIESFTCDLSSLTNGNGMFSNNPNNINTFIGDLSSLTNGMSMFTNDYQLTTFISDLSSLTVGRDMFSRTNLSLESVECIADTINTFSAQIDISWQTLPAEESERQALVNELSRIVDKGWTLGTNEELLPLFDSEKYETGLSTVQPLDLDSEPQTIYYVVKK